VALGVRAGSASLWQRRRGLIVFWALILAGAAGGAGYLQHLGPPPGAVAPLPAPAPPAPAAQPAAPAPAPPPQAAQAAPPPPAVATTVGVQSGLARGVPIPSPSPKLLTASAINHQWLIPRIGADGATPMQTYAASQLPPAAADLLPPDAPRIALIVAGLGDDLALAQVAASLPPQISLALSPYGKTVVQAAAAARAAGHETLLILPMPGLLAAAPEQQNQATFDWSMAQWQGYAGVTDAFGPAMGGGFMANDTAKTWLLTDIARRGLFYIEGDLNAGAAPYVTSRSADIVLDDGQNQADEAAKLGSLVTVAESQHAALGIMLNPTPAALRTLAGWTDTLANEDILLVPASALVLPSNVPLPVAASTKQ
jgi:polysaccharide deacetylase 2 family uncharacterized protein YibQ